MERSYKTLFKLFLFLQKQFILDAWLGPEYAPDLFSSRIVLIYLHLWNKTLLGFYIHKYCKVFFGGGWRIWVILEVSLGEVQWK